MSLPRWIINADPQDRSGLVQEAAGTSFAGSPRFIRDEVLQRQIEPLINGASVDITGATLKVGVGKLDLAPTGGTFDLAYLGLSTGLTGLSYAITAAALQTALNSNANISAAGNVTVDSTGTSALFTISFNNVGARSLITGADTGLIPPSYIRVVRKVTGDASTKEVQILQIFQRPFGYSTDWTPNAAGTVSITNPVAGDASTPARFQIAFSDVPYTGAVRFAWAVPQITRCTFAANVGLAQTEHIDFSTATAAGFGGNYVDFYKVDGTILRFWGNENATDTAPSTPPGGTLVVVAYAAAATASAIATAFSTAVAANAEFSAALTGLYTATTVRAVRASAGTRAASVAASGAGTPTVLSVTVGTDGPLAGKCLPLVDRFGSVGVYFTSGGTSTIPTAASACNRQIPVAIATNATAAAVASAFQVAVDADAELVATVASNQVDVTDAFSGTRVALTTGTATGCSAVVTRRGRSIAASLGYGDEASVMEAALSDEFAVTILDAQTWILVASEPNVVPSPTVASESLTWPRYFTGTLRFDTVALEYAFAGTTASSLDAPLEVVITYPTKEPEVILQVNASCDRNLIRATGISTPSFTGASWTIDASGNLVALVAGVSLAGGINANDDLIIQGTTNATKTTSNVSIQTTGGDVLMGTKGAKYADASHTFTIGDYAGSGPIVQISVDADLITVSFSDCNFSGRIKVGVGGSTASISKTLSATSVWDPPSIVNGASSTQSGLVLNGVAVGDVVTAAHTSIVSPDWAIQACVTSANTVSVKITNNTGGTVDLASGTLRINCIKFV
jgi:hypothetical protein